MTYQDYFQTILESDVADWICCENLFDGLDLYVYQKDISISICQSNHTMDLGSKWAATFSEPKATRILYYFKYNGAPIKDFCAELVDGEKIFIPPSDDNNSVTRIEYQIGKILNICCPSKDDYDKHLQQAGITVRT
jgi:hypothetical protein